MNCTKCGSQISEGNKFCTKCGEKVSDTAPNNFTQKPALNFGLILSKAFKYSWKNKSLWFFGVILAIFAGGSSGGNYGSSTSNEPSEKSINAIVDVFKNPGAIAVIVIIGIIILLLIILSIILKNWALSALIKGTLKVEDNQNITIREISKTGKKTVWRLIVLNFFIPAAFILGLVVIIILGFLLFSIIPQPMGLIIGIILAVTLILAFIPLYIYLFIVWSMASRYVVANDQGPIQAISSAKQLIKNNFWMTFAYSFVSGIIAGFGSCLGSILFIIFLLITIAAIFSGNFILIVILGVITLTALLFYLIVFGYFCAFKETGLTIWWNDLKKLKEFDKK